jgi:hypothetical protein
VLKMVGHSVQTYTMILLLVFANISTNVPRLERDELGAAITWHAALAIELGAQTEFRLLNQV